MSGNRRPPHERQSVAGPLYGSHLYPASQVSGHLGTDALNLAVGLTMPLGSMWLARHGSLLAFFVRGAARGHVPASLGTKES